MRGGWGVGELEDGDGFAFDVFECFEAAAADVHVEGVWDDHGFGVVGVEGDAEGLAEGFDGLEFYEDECGLEVEFGEADFENIAVACGDPFLIPVVACGVADDLDVLAADVGGHAHAAAGIDEGGVEGFLGGWESVPEADHAGDEEAEVFDFFAEVFEVAAFFFVGFEFSVPGFDGVVAGLGGEFDFVL